MVVVVMYAFVVLYINTYVYLYSMYYYTPCLKKLCKLIFLSELCQIYTDCKNFWHKDSRENKLFCNVLIFHLT